MWWCNWCQRDSYLYGTCFTDFTVGCKAGRKAVNWIIMDDKSCTLTDSVYYLRVVRTCIVETVVCLWGRNSLTIQKCVQTNRQIITVFFFFVNINLCSKSLTFFSFMPWVSVNKTWISEFILINKSTFLKLFCLYIYI